MGNRKITKKWLKCDPQQPANEVAQAAFANRLNKIAKLSEDSSFHFREDIEHIHDLRVATRRGQAMLRFFREFADPEALGQVLKSLSKIRKAAGRARDLDVLIERTQPLEFLLRKRKKAQKRILAAHAEYVESGLLRSQIEKLCEASQTTVTDSRLATVAFADWAIPRLVSIIEKSLATWPSDTSDIQRLHDLRIELKHLRYTIELVGSALDPNVKSNTYPLLRSVQNVLGNINDHGVAIEKITKWLRKLNDKEQVTALEKILKAEEARLAEAIESFQNDWASQDSPARHALLNGLPRRGQ